MPRYPRSRSIDQRAADQGTHPWGRYPDEPLHYWIHFPKHKNKTKFDLTVMAEYVHEAEPASIAIVRLFASGSYKTARGSLEEIRRAAKYLKKQHPKLKPFDAKSEEGSQKNDWEAAIRSYANVAIVEAGDKQRTAGQRILCLNRVINCLSRNRRFPSITLITGKPNRHKTSTARDSLLEQVRTPTESEKELAKNNALNDAVAEMQQLLPEEERTSLKDVLVNLAMNLTGPPPRTADEMINALKRLIEECIAKLSAVASENFKEWQRNFFPQSTPLTASQTRDSKLFGLALSGDRKAQKKFLDRAQAGLEKVIPATLGCLRKLNGGYAPATISDDHAARFFLEDIYKLVPRRELNARMHPSSRCVTAAIVLTLCESALNVEVASAIALPLGIQPDPDIPEAFVVSAIKERAGGAYVISVLTKDKSTGNIPAIEAMEVLANAGKDVRERYTQEANLRLSESKEQAYDSIVVSISSDGNGGGDDKSASAAQAQFPPSPLFCYLSRHSNEACAANTPLVRRYLTLMLEESGLSTKFKFTPAAIRPCVLMLHGMSKNPNSQIVAILANHADESNATSSYAFSRISRMRAHMHMREYHSRLAELAKNRGKDSKSAANDDDIASDSTCTQLVHLSEPLILDAVLTLRCLERSNEQLVNNRRTHWIENCEPELAWAMVVLEKAEKSSLAHKIPKIELKAKDLIATGYNHHLET